MTWQKKAVVLVAAVVMVPVLTIVAYYVGSFFSMVSY